MKVNNLFCFLERISIKWILLFGFLIRLSFLLFGAELYYGREDFYYDTDTMAWFDAFKNLIDIGIFTVSPDNPFGYFGRIPGFSFYFGFFYLLCGQDFLLATKVISCFQTTLDTFAVYFVWKIAQNIFQNIYVSKLSSILYASYPFIIVWVPVSYAECIGIFLMILCLYCFSAPDLNHKYLYAGICISLSTLNRPQIALLIPLLFLGIIWIYRVQKIKMVKYLVQYSLMVMIIYGSWPVRNYLNYGVLMLTQDVRGIWQHDKVAFMHFLHTVKMGWEPQYSDVLKGERLELPEQIKWNRDDSLKLLEAESLIQTCGFAKIYRTNSKSIHHASYFDRTPMNPSLSLKDCKLRITQLLNELRSSFIANNKVQYWIAIPLQNLKKAILKSDLTDQGSSARKAASLLFKYRTIFIVLGLTGIIFAFFSRNLESEKRIMVLIIACYATFLYFILCFGTGVQNRNIEIRYFLPADILLLFPASYLIVQIVRKIIYQTKILSC